MLDAHWEGIEILVFTESFVEIELSQATCELKHIYGELY